jgi:hypothetical protein
MFAAEERFNITAGRHMTWGFSWNNPDGAGSVYYNAAKLANYCVDVREIPVGTTESLKLTFGNREYAIQAIYA